MYLDQMMSENKKILEKIRSLEKDKNVLLYKELVEYQKNLYEHIREDYIKIKVNEYNSCEHLWVELPYFETNKSYVLAVGCVRCGVDTGIVKLKKRDEMSLEEEAMYEYLSNGINRSYNFVNTVCDLKLARSICLKILKNYPEIDNRTLARYFLSALYHIKNVEVNDYRKDSREKRLGLKKAIR